MEPGFPGPGSERGYSMARRAIGARYATGKSGEESDAFDYGAMVARLTMGHPVCSGGAINARVVPTRRRHHEPGRGRTSRGALPFFYYED